MPENEKDPAPPTNTMDTDTKETGKTCLEIKALREQARELIIAENARLQGLPGFSISTDEILYESKSTNTEEQSKGIYFGYPSRRHSCALVNIPTPCISKMISQIEDVESEIQEHLKQFETSFEEWTSATKDAKEDMDVTAPKKEVLPEKTRDETCPELKKKMEKLLSDAIYLIRSLETDRAEAEQALRQQKSRKKRICMKIDSWSIWKLQELPTAVQREYDHYAKDIAELHCHLEDKNKKLIFLEKQKEKLEQANAKIQKDIDFMNHHAPLLKAKQKEELKALKQCYHKKFEVMELYREVHQELQVSVVLSENAKSKLKFMREDDAKDIQQEQTNIDSYKKELGKLCNLQTHYSSSIEAVNVHIEEDEEAMSEMLREAESSTNEVSNLLRNVDDLKRMFDQYSWKQKKLEDQYMEALNDYYSAKRAWDIETSNILNDFKDMTTTCNTTGEENKNIMSEIDKLTAEISKSIMRKTEYESEIQSLHELKIKNNAYLKHIYKQSYQTGAVYHLAKHKTEELEEKISEVRRKFKNREDFLKKLTRGEMSTGLHFQKRLYSMEENHFVEMQEFLRRKALYNLALAEVQLPLSHIEEDVERIREHHRQHSFMLHDIYKKRETIKKRVQATKIILRKKTNKSRKELTKTEGKRSLIHQEIQLTKSKTILLKEKSKELVKAIKIMKLEKINYDDRLEKLNEEFIKLKFDKETGEGIYEHLWGEKQKCEERLFDEDIRFRRITEARKSTLAELQKQQEDLLAENRRLAKEYQALQVIFLKVKEDFFNGYDRQLSLNASLCDKKKLCQLQRRLDREWKEYFWLMTQYNQSRLEKFEGDSQNSIQKILVVQEESSKLMQHILEFFKTFRGNLCEKD